jgi:hypothetical protein
MDMPRLRLATSHLIPLHLPLRLFRPAMHGMALANVAAMRPKDRHWNLSLLALLAVVGLAVLVWLG